MGLKTFDIERLEMNPFTLMDQEWMLITAGDANKCNTMTASWGGLGELWNKNVATIYVRPQRYTREFLDREDHFSLSFFDERYRKALQLCGTKSGRDCEKIKEANLTPVFDAEAPYFQEARLVLVCRKLYHTVLTPDGFVDQDVHDKNYPEKDYHIMYIGEVERVYNGL